jgi:hypothetical protein
MISTGANKALAVMTRILAAWMAVLAGFGAGSAQAGFRSPESLVRNVYAYYGDGSSELSSGLPHDPDTARQFFDPALRAAWISLRREPYDFMVQSVAWKIGAVAISVLRRQYDRIYVAAAFTNQGRAVTLNFILVNGDDGWVIADVESPHDSLRMFLVQYRN